MDSPADSRGVRAVLVLAWVAMILAVLWKAEGAFWRGAEMRVAAAAQDMARGDFAGALSRLSLDPDPREDSGALVARGYAALERDRFGTAAEAFRRALELRPADPEARLGLAEALILTPATESVPEAVSLLASPDSCFDTPDRRIRAARLLEMAGAPRRAYAFYEGITSAESLVARSRIDAVRGDYGRAAALLEEADRQADLSTAEIARLAYALHESGDLAEAREAYRRLEARGDLDQRSRVRYAWLLAELGEHRAADSVLPDGPDVGVDVLELRSKLRFWTGDPAGALPLLRSYLALVPGDGEARRMVSSARRTLASGTSGAPPAGRRDRSPASGASTRRDPTHRSRDTARARDLVAVGLRLEEAGLLEKAAEAYREAERRSPDGDPEIHLRLARTRHWTEDHLGAIPWFRRYLAATPADEVSPGALVDYAAALLEAGFPTEALMELDPVLRKPAPDSVVLLLGARAATAADRPEDAVRLLRELRRRFALGPDRTVWLAGQIRAAGDPEAALREYEAAIAGALDIGPDGWEAVGDLRLAAGEPARALAAYRRARREGAGVPPDKLGRALQASGDYASALHAYRVHLREHPEDPAARLSRARLRARLHRPDSALSDYERYLALEGPSGLEAELARVHLAAGRFEEAATWARRGLRNNVAPWEARLALAQAHRFLGHREAADGLFRRLEARELSGPEGSIWDARVALAEGRPIRAGRSLRRMLDEAPGPAVVEDPALWLLRGDAARARGDVARARSALDSAASLGADTVDVRVAERRHEEVTASEVTLPAGFFADDGGVTILEEAADASLWPWSRMKLGLAARRTRVEQRDRSLTTTGVSARFDRFFPVPDLELAGGLGSDFLDDGTESLSAWSSVRWHAGDGSWVDARGSRTLVWNRDRPGSPRPYSRIASVAALQPGLYTETVVIGAQRSFDLHRRARIELGRSWYDDGNRQDFLYGHYQVPLETRAGRWSALAPNVYVETFDRQVDGYFSPGEYVSLGVRAQTKRSLGGWSLEAETNPHIYRLHDRWGLGIEGIVTAGYSLGGITPEVGGYVFFQGDDYSAGRGLVRISIPTGPSAR